MGRKPSAAPSLFGMALIGEDPLSPPGTTIALASRAKLVTELCSCWYCQNKLLTQDGAAWAQGPCHWQIQTDCFQIPVNALLAQKCSVPSQPIPKRQASSGPSHPKQDLLGGPSPSVIFYFSLLYSFSYKIFLPSTPFCSYPKEDSPLHKVLNKV